MNPFGHIDLRVRDIEKAFPFYSKLLPALGFPKEWTGDDSFSFQTEGDLPDIRWFGVSEDPDDEPNASRIAFAVESCDEVDRLAKIIAEAGAGNIEGPEDCPYTRIYYAIFFEDPSGNCLEVYYAED